MLAIGSSIILGLVLFSAIQTGSGTFKSSYNIALYSDQACTIPLVPWTFGDLWTGTFASEKVFYIKNLGSQNTLYSWSVTASSPTDSPVTYAMTKAQPTQSQQPWAQNTLTIGYSPAQLVECHLVISLPLQIDQSLFGTPFSFTITITANNA